MACRVISLPGGATAIVCGPRGRGAQSCNCGSGLPANKLCDFELPRLRYRRQSGSKTCDRKICAKCATHVEPDTDYCREHSSRMPVGSNMELF